MASFIVTEEIYLDHAATAPPAPGVVEAVCDAMTAAPGNPSSLHRPGQRGARLIAEAGERLAGLIGAESRELVWTSGATEASNLALRGVAAFLGQGSQTPPHIVSAVTEHAATRDTLSALAGEGVRV